MTTPNLSLPELIASQSQPHVPINAALRRLDALVQLTVVSISNTPPGSPADGDRYIVGTSPTGAWAGHENEIAAYIGTGWTYWAPGIGWLAFVQSVAALHVYGAGSPLGWDEVATGGGGGGGLEAYERTIVAVIVTQNSPPGSPSAGDIYRVGDVPAGSWSSYEPGAYAYYDGSAWSEIIPPVGSLCYGGSGGGLYLNDGTISTPLWRTVYQQPPDDVWIVASYVGMVPNDHVLLRWYVPKDMEFPADFASAHGICATPPEAAWTASVQINGTEIGTIAVSTGGVFTFLTDLNDPQSIYAEDILTIVAPNGSPDDGPIDFDVALMASPL